MESEASAAAGVLEPRESRTYPRQRHVIVTLVMATGWTDE